MLAGIVAVMLMAAPEVDLKLPPSEAWVEQKDPNPLPTSTATSRYFVRKDDPTFDLRVITEPSMRLDYTLPVLAELSKRFIVGQKKQGRHGLHLSDPRVFVVEGVNVGSFQVMDLTRTSTLFYLPSEGGDRVVTINGPSGQSAPIQEIMTFVQTAKQLRKPEMVESGRMFMGAIAVVSLSVIGVLLFFMRKRA